MLTFAYRLDESKKSAKDVEALNIYSDFYGLTNKDLGLYALVDNKIAGAIWIRRLNVEHNANGFIDETTPVLTIGVKPEFRKQGIAKAMLAQLLQECGSLYENVSVSVLNNASTQDIFEKLGFAVVKNSNKKSPIDNAEVVTMTIKVPKEAVVRPTDGYDPTRWMD